MVGAVDVGTGAGRVPDRTGIWGSKGKSSSDVGIRQHAAYSPTEDSEQGAGVDCTVRRRGEKLQLTASFGRSEGRLQGGLEEQVWMLVYRMR